MWLSPSASEPGPGLAALTENLGKKGNWAVI
jgi:hypothetical protein